MTVVARAEIPVEVHDQQAIAALRRVDAEFDRTMDHIGRERAEATVGANLSELRRDLRAASAELEKWERKRAEAGGRLNRSDAASLGVARKRVALLEQQSGVQTRILEQRKAEHKLIALTERELQAKQRAEEQRERVIAAAQKRRLAAVNHEARVRSALNRQRERELSSSERAAYAENEQRGRAITQAARERAEVLKLQQQYRKLTDDLEALDKRNAFTREARAKLDLDTKDALAKFELVKKELQRRGAHPPVDIKVDVDRRGMQRVTGFFSDTIGRIAQKASGLSDVTLRIGPFTASVKQFGIALATLGPILTSVGASVVSLAGVVGTGLAGAMAVGAGGVAGMILQFGGLAAAIAPVIGNYKDGIDAADAYKQAVLQYGKGSDQAKTAQEKMNKVMEQINPTARKAVEGIGGVKSEWQKLTSAAAERSIGDVLAGGLEAANAILPTFAKNTNDTMGIVSEAIVRIEKAAASPAGVHMIDSLGRSFNEFLGPALSGLTHLGAAFIHVGEAAMRIFGGRAGRGFEEWAKGIDAATQPGEVLDEKITRLGNHTRDLMKFFGALGRVIIDVLGGSANAGDGLLKSMTATLDKWDEFLDSAEGKQSMADFFERAADGARSLWHAIGPLVGAFVQWSDLLAPFSAGLLEGVGLVTRFIGKITDLIGLGGPLGALGATLGALWAVGKIGAFVAYLGQAVGLMRTLGAMGTIKAMLGFDKAGGFFAQMKNANQGSAIRAALAEGGGQAAAAMRAGIVQGAQVAAGTLAEGEAAGGRVAAAEQEAGIASGGRIAAAEEEAGVAAGGRVAAAEIGAGMRAGGAAGAAGGALGRGAGVMGFIGRATPYIAAAAAMTYGVIKLNQAMDKTGNAINGQVKAFHRGSQAAYRARHSYNELRASLGDAGSAIAHDNLTLQEARKRLDDTKAGTVEHKQALLDYRDAQRQVTADRAEFTKQSGDMIAASKREVVGIYASRKATMEEIEARRRRIQVDKAMGKSTEEDEKKLAMLTGRMAELNTRLNQAYNRRAAAAIQVARAEKGLVALSGQAEQSVGQLARTMPKLAMEIGVKFEDPAAAGRVAAAAAAAIQAHIPSRKVMKIVADSKDATEALRRLNRFTLHKKVVEITAHDRVARRALRGLFRYKLPTKTLRVIADVMAAVKAHGHLRELPNIAKVLKMLGNNHDARIKFLRVLGYKIPNKYMKTLGRDVNAKHLIMTLQNMQIRDKSFTITAYHKSVGVGRAQGGPVTPQEKDVQRAVMAARKYETGLPAQQRWANSVVDEAVSRPTRPARSQKVNRPTLLVGEEDRTEYVIATNPAYKSANVRYLSMAASELGYAITPAYGGDSFADNARQHPRRPGYVQAEDGSWVPGGFYSRSTGRDRMVRAEDGSWVPITFYTRIARDRKFHRGQHSHVARAERHLRSAAREVGLLDVQPAAGGFHGGKHRSVGQTYHNAPLSLLLGIPDAVQGVSRGTRFQPQMQWGAGNYFTTVLDRNLPQRGSDKLPGVHGDYATMWFSDLPMDVYNNAYRQWKDLYRDVRESAHRRKHPIPTWAKKRNRYWDQSHSKVARSKRLWQGEERDISLLDAAMTDADSRPDNQSKLFDGKPHPFGWLKSKRQKLIEDHVVYDKNVQKVLDQGQKDMRAQFGRGPWYELAHEAYAQVTSSLIELSDAARTNKGRLPQVQAPDIREITEEQLLEHYVGTGYSASKILNQLRQRLGIAQGTEAVIGPGEDIDIQRQIRDFYFNLFQATQGKRPNPVTGQKEPLGQAWQATAAIAYAREREALSSLQGQGLSAQTSPQVISAREIGALRREFAGNTYARDSGGAIQQGAMITPAGRMQGTGAIYDPRNQSGAMATSDPGGQFSTGSGQFSVAGRLRSARVAGGATAFSRQPTPIAGGGVSKSLTVTNNFLTQPNDPLTWSRGVKYDLELM